MNDSLHQRAKQLIAQERIEGLSASDQQWLQQHLQDCSDCAAVSSATTQALRSLRAISVPVSANLASRTQFRVRLRAQQLQVQEPRWRIVWLSCAASWIFGAATAPYVWRGLQYLGHRAGVPNIVWQMSFALWWALPAIAVGAILLAENARRGAESDWLTQLK